MIGRARRIDDARGRYVQFAKDTFPEHLRLDGLKVVIDCANGAAYHVAPDALWELGAEVIPLGVKPNGLNINDGCGSTYPELLQDTVVASGADIGLALDGDADRLIVVDEQGRMVDGDQLMALIALGLQRRGELRGDAVVATVMSNLGLERKLGEAGLAASSGPRSATAMCSRRCARAAATSAASSRGTSSSPTMRPPGTGSSPGCRCWRRWSTAKRPASELLRQFEPLPQLLKNVRFNGGVEPLEADSVRKRIAAAEAELEGKGPAGHPQIGHRAADPGDGRGRRPRAGRAAGRRHLRGRPVRRVNHLFAIVGETLVRAHGKLRPGSGTKADSMTSTARILIIAGSDSGGGAGIQADIKTVTMLGGHAMTAVTAITAQNTLGVTAIHPVPAEMILAQIDAVVADIGVDAVKIGMIGSAFAARQVAVRLEELQAADSPTCRSCSIR